MVEPPTMLRHGAERREAPGEEVPRDAFGHDRIAELFLGWSTGILARFGSCDIGLDAETARIRERMHFNDCVHVLQSEGAGTFAVAKEKSLPWRKDRTSNASFTVRSDVAKDTMSAKMSDKCGGRRRRQRRHQGQTSRVCTRGGRNCRPSLRCSPLLPLPATSTTCTKFLRQDSGARLVT